MRQIRYKDFSRDLDGIGVNKRIPTRAMFELTYRCNFNCIHCYIADTERKQSIRDELDTKDVFKILDQLQDIGCFTLAFTGGEIFLREDILDILWYTKRKGFNIILFTNASLIDRKIADELAKLMPNKVDISLHSMNKEIFEKITRVKDYYKKVIWAIKLLNERDIPLCLKSTCMQDNKDIIPEIGRFAREINAQYRINQEIKPRRDRSKEPYSYSIDFAEYEGIRRVCHPEMFERYDEKGNLRKKIKPRRHKIEKVFNCVAGYNGVAINPFGQLNICITIDYPKYKILEGSLKAGWELIKHIIDNTSPDENFKCNNCKLLPYCSWCPAKGWLEDGRFTTCSPINRRQAEAMRKLYEEKDFRD